MWPLFLLPHQKQRVMESTAASIHLPAALFCAEKLPNVVENPVEVYQVIPSICPQWFGW